MKFTPAWIPWILVVIIGLFLFFDLKGCFKPKGGTAGIKPVDSTFYWKTKLGDTVISLKGQIEGFGLAKQTYIDSVAKIFAAQKSAYVQEIIDLKAQGHVIIYSDTGHKPFYVYQDTGSAQKLVSVNQVYTNPWYFANAHVNLIDYSKSYLDLVTHDSLLIDWQTVKSGGLFNRKTEVQLNVKNSNPYNTFTSAKAYKAPAVPVPKWTLSVGVGWGYGINATGGAYGYPIIGLFIGRTLIKL